MAPAQDQTATPQVATRRRLVLAVLCAAPFVLVLDTTIVTVALPSIGRDLGFSTATLHWVLASYALVFGGLLLLGGRLGDLFGHRRPFLAGAALFALASAVGGLAVAPWRRGCSWPPGSPKGSGRQRSCRPPWPWSPVPFRTAPNATALWGSTRGSPPSARPPAWSWAASSPSSWAGDRCCSPRCRSRSPRSSCRHRSAPAQATGGSGSRLTCRGPSPSQPRWLRCCMPSRRRRQPAGPQPSPSGR
jgi:Major Facilitator Superfamily